MRAVKNSLLVLSCMEFSEMLYAFVLDIFPLLDLMSAENPVLSATIQQEALDLVQSKTVNAEKIDRLCLLLRIAHDLGYIDDDVHRYLAKHAQLLKTNST